MKGSVSKNSPRTRRIINAMFIRSSGGDRRPRIFAADGVFPAAKEFEERFEQIRDEVDQLLASRTITRYKDIDPVRAAEVSENWRLYYAYMLGKPNERAKTDCPTILDIAQRTPGIVNAFIAVLDGGVNLAAHCGPYAGILRYHLGLRVPKERPPTLRIDNQYYTWKEGEGIVIDDVFEHEVTNESDSIRVILIVDFRRPMGLVNDSINRLCLSLKQRWSASLINTANGDI